MEDSIVSRPDEPIKEVIDDQSLYQTDRLFNSVPYRKMDLDTLRFGINNVFQDPASVEVLAKHHDPARVLAYMAFNDIIRDNLTYNVPQIVQNIISQNSEIDVSKKDMNDYFVSNQEGIKRSIEEGMSLNDICSSVLDEIRGPSRSDR